MSTSWDEAATKTPRRKPEALPCSLCAGSGGYDAQKKPNASCVACRGSGLHARAPLDTRIRKKPIRVKAQVQTTTGSVATEPVRPAGYTDSEWQELVALGWVNFAPKFRLEA